MIRRTLLLLLALLMALAAAVGFVASIGPARGAAQAPQSTYVWLYFHWEGISEVTCWNGRSQLVVVQAYHVDGWGSPGWHEYSIYTDTCGAGLLILPSWGAQNFHLWTKGGKWLSTGISDYFICGNCTVWLQVPEAEAGDAVQDNIVSILDWNAMKNAYGSACGQPSYNSQADFDEDCVVGLYDYLVIRNNFGDSGNCPPIGGCYGASK